jgi:serine/threonine-protein kinase
LYVLAPSKVALPKPATAVAVTDSSSHAWLTDRTIASWGNNAGGQLGIGSTASSAPTPTLIPSFFADGFSAGYASACARVGDYLECWGANPQVGAGTATGTYTSPTFVVMYDYSTASGFTGDQLAVVGSDSCVVDRSSGLHCWGVNGSGQLLTGDTTNVSHYVGTLSNVSSLGQSATNTATICAVRSAGSVDCWGRDLVSGTSVTTPTTVPGTSGATSVAVGRQHACAILTGGSLVCWGQNGGYQLGATSPSSSATPLTVPLSGVTQVSAGDSFTCAVAAGRAYCWGNGGQGQLGNGAKTATAAPTEPAWP